MSPNNNDHPKSDPPQESAKPMNSEEQKFDVMVKVRTRYTKNTTEANRYVRADDRSKYFVLTVSYRTGEFSVVMPEEELRLLDTESEDAEFRPYDYSECELLETLDSWSAEITDDNLKLTKRKRDQLFSKFAEGGETALEELGYIFDEADYTLTGPLDIEIIERIPASDGSWPF